MRLFFTLLTGWLFGTLALAQPANDECASLINLGTLPACSGTIYTNTGATASNIGTRNSPSCFNGGATERDVWFAFTVSGQTTDVTIQLRGVANGPSGRAIRNPQIALYRGDCQLNGLSEIGCATSPNGATQTNLDVSGLIAGLTYFVRVNDYSATAAPNSGDFTLCVDRFAPAVNMGQAPGSSACFGTLYDSGGPNGNYRNFEDLSFTICPSQPHSCIEIDLVNFDIEPDPLLGLFAGDVLEFYAGSNSSAPLLARVRGRSLGTPFRIQAASECVTVRFQSDFLGTFPGFELNWRCSSAPCENQSLNNPTVVGSLPFVRTGLSTCESASTFANSPCAEDNFLGGPEYVFTYQSAGRTCIGVQVTGAAAGTGVSVLSGPPGDPGTICVANSSSGVIAAAELNVSGTYYIVVANRQGCTPFNLRIEESNCTLSPSLTSALCNPLNGCTRTDGLPTTFFFERGFQDITVREGVNNGCWLGLGVQPNFYWFTIQSAANGDFGFIIDSNDPLVFSDLDFNVWGPFRQDEVCDNPNEVIRFITNNQPIRSSWSPTPGPTGLVNVHPITRQPVRDEYDCGNTPGPDGDDFVRTIQTRQGEVYVVLINDWSGLIGSEGVRIDWSPSGPGVLDRLETVVNVRDTSICLGESVQISLDSPVNNITWLNDTNTLSCNNCPNPIATPVRTTTYRALVDAVCYNDTIEVKVEVYSVNAGPDLTVCRGEQFEINAGEAFDDATYSWTAPAAIELSCTDCPNPVVTALQPGAHTLTVTLNAPNCTPTDAVVITVLNEEAPRYDIAKGLDICRGDTVAIGGESFDGSVYSWSSVPAGFSSTEANPAVAPTATTTYFLSVSSATCPITKLDSVTVRVFEPPVLQVAADTLVCQEQPVLLGLGEPELGVVYEWEGPEFIDNPEQYQATAFPRSAGNYILTATRGACEVKDTVVMNITPIDIDIFVNGDTPDTVRICRGEDLILTARALPTGVRVVWSPNDGSLSDTTGLNVIARPQTQTTYFATVRVDDCVRTDTLVVIVDSLPTNLAIMPVDTSVCQGSLVLLTSEVYEPRDFMDIKFQWVGQGQQTPDSLYNMVVIPDTTTRYFRVTTSGVCVDTTYANVMVKPIPILTITPSDTLVCPGQQIAFRVERPDGTTDPMWSPATGLSCTECFDPIATAVNTVTYMLEAELDGCPGQAAASLQVFPTPAFQLNPEPEICLGESIQLNFVSTNGAIYTWTSPDIPGFTSNDPLLRVTPNQTTRYRVVAQVPSCNPVEAEITVTVIQPANVTVPGDQTVCEGDALTLTATGTLPGRETYLWRWNGQSSNQASITVTNLRENTVFELTYVYGNNCGVITRTVNVQVEANVIIEGIDVEPMEYISDGVPAGDLVTLRVNTDPPAPAGATYAWTANGESIPGNTAVLQHRPLEAGMVTYEVTITSPNGCEAIGSIELNVNEPEYMIPNAFTPNGDGRNDFFNVVTKGLIEIVQFRVYNRWGQLVYNNTNPSQGWDGNVNGRPAPSDVYVYTIMLRFPNGREVTESGNVTLIR